MPFYERGYVRSHHQEGRSELPLLVIAGGASQRKDRPAFWVAVFDNRLRQLAAHADPGSLATTTVNIATTAP